jgi:hypothetical protein
MKCFIRYIHQHIEDAKVWFACEFLFFSFFLKLGIFFIYISNAIPKVPHTPPHFHTHPFPLLGPGVLLY